MFNQFGSCILYNSETILAVRKIGHLNIRTKLFEFEAHVLIGWLARVFASQPIRTRTSKSNIFVFMLRWPTFLMATRFRADYNCFNVALHIIMRPIKKYYVIDLMICNLALKLLEYIIIICMKLYIFLLLTTIFLKYYTSSNMV